MPKVLNREVLRGRLRAGFASAAAPLTYLLIFLLLLLVSFVFDAPAPDELLSQAIELLREHGLIVVGAAALLEGLAFLTLWFPGSFVILVAMSAARGMPAHAVLLVAVITVSFWFSAQLNFVVGRFGLQPLVTYLDGGASMGRASKWSDHYGEIGLVAAFVHPSLGGFFGVASGANGMPWKRYATLSAIAIIGWNAVWGAALYLLAPQFARAASHPGGMAFLLLTWTCVSFGVGFVRAKPSAHQLSPD